MSANPENCCDTAAELQESFIDLRTQFNDLVQHTSLEHNSLTSQVNHLRKLVNFEKKRTQKVINNNERLKVRILSLERRVAQLENPPEPPSSEEEEEQQEEEQDEDPSDNSVVPAVVN